MKLYLMRHGEYVQTERLVAGSLSAKGVSDIKKLASFLQPLDIQVLQIVHSEKIRAKETANIMSAALDCSLPPQQQQGLNPDDDINQFESELSGYEDNLFVVGHLPFIPRLVAKLLCGNENKELVVFRPGTILCMEKSDDQKWLINWMISPDLFI